MRFGYTCCRIMTADSAALLRKMTACGLFPKQAQLLDLWNIEMILSSRMYPKLQALTLQRGENCQVVWQDRGGYLFFYAFRRPVLLIPVVLMLFLSFWLPGRILFFQVEGNSLVSSEKILSEAETFGVRFGCSAGALQPQRIKTELLHSFPELSWVGISAKGSCLHIRVTERKDFPTQTLPDVPTGIYAARDGVIVEMNVARGDPLTAPGQAVRKGDLLVTGIRTAGDVRHCFHAQAEIFARTNHQLKLIRPTFDTVRGTQYEKNVKYSLQIGKKLIKFYQDSGISDTGCVKIYETIPMTLFDDFTLPIMWIVETSYDYQPAESVPEADCAELSRLAQQYVNSVMIAGTVDGATESVYEANDCVVFTGSYSCTEMIGQRFTEEIESDE